MNMFARDYKIEVAADNKDCVFWKMIRKGEHVSPTDEDKEMAVAMLRKVLMMMETSLKDYRQRKRDEQLPTMEILRELQVTTEHFNEFQQMMKDGELERMTFNSYEHPTIRLWLRGGQTCVETGGWLILDTEHRWRCMDNEYHKRLAAMGKIKIIK
jgi:hypothetical protein